jgi:hypothetical protein
LQLGRALKFKYILIALPIFTAMMGEVESVGGESSGVMTSVKLVYREFYSLTFLSKSMETLP